MAFACPRCGVTSQNPTDEQEGYCGRCHEVTGDEPVRYGHLPLLTVFELRQLLVLLPDPSDYMHTAVAEAILNARSDRHSRAIQSLYALSRMLDTMKVSTMAGLPEVNGLRIFERVLKAIEGFVRDHGVLEAHQGAQQSDRGQVIELPNGEPPEWLLALLEAPPQ